MPAYVHQHNLGVCPISELDHSWNPYGNHIPLVGLGSGQAEPLGFTLLRVQIEGMPHYDEHQVVFILDDPSAFSARIPVILGTPTINRVVQTMKESEMHDAPTEWQTARVTYEWAQGFQFHPASLGERPCSLPIPYQHDRRPIGPRQKGPADRQVHNTRFPVHCCSWSYSEDDDDGEPVERHDTGTLS